MPTELLMPALSPTMEEGTLAKWLVKEGDEVSSGDLIAEIETDKATMEFEAVDEGVVLKLLVAQGSEGVKVNTPIAVIGEEGESADDVAKPVADAPAPEISAPSTPAAAPIFDPVKMPGDSGERLFATPLARRIAADKGIDLSLVKGSGPRGRIIKLDVDTFTKPATQAAAPKASAPAPAPTGPSTDAVMSMYADRDFTEVALDGMRKTIAARLSEAKQTIPHFYLRRDIQLDALLSFRSTLNKQLEARGVKLSVNDFIIKAGALALQEVPAANSVWAGDRILQLSPSDVAVAVAIDGGLFTPVLKDAHLKSLSGLLGPVRKSQLLALMEHWRQPL